VVLVVLVVLVVVVLVVVGLLGGVGSLPWERCGRVDVLTIEPSSPSYDEHRGQRIPRAGTPDNTHDEELQERTACVCAYAYVCMCVHGMCV